MRNQERIKLTDSALDIIVKMSDGNPGAVNVLYRIMKDGESIDPDSFAGGLGAIMILDTYGIYGSRIYLLVRDVCNGCLIKTLAMIRAVQLGIIPELLLQHAIDFRGEGIDVEDLLKKVQERLPKFGIINAAPTADQE